MKLKDSTIISLLVFTWICIVIGVLGAESELSKIEQQVNVLCNTQENTITKVAELSDYNMVQDERMAKIEHHNLVQDYRLDRHRQELDDMNEMFGDLLDSTERLEEYMRSLPDNAWGIEITEEDEYLIASLVYLEAGADWCSYDLQKAIATVFFNQMTHYNLTVQQTIYRAGAFSVASRVRYTKPSPQCRAAVRYVLENGGTMPRNVLAFQTGGYHSFWRPYIKIQNVYFNTI